MGNKSGNKSGIVLGIVLATIVLVAAIGGASADTAISSLPYNADVPGEYYYLTQDLSSADTSTAGINVTANGITIDGRGYSITGSKAPGACAATESNPAVHSGVRVRDGSYDDVVIMDLEIKDFCTGIALGWIVADNVDNVTVTDCEIHDNGVSDAGTHGIHMVYTNDCNITGNSLYSNDGTGTAGGCSGGGDGIFMYGEKTTQRGWYNSFTCNNFSYNTKSGFFMKHQCMHNTISYNKAIGNNEEGGIVPMCKRSNFNTIEYNVLSDNAQWGYYTRGTGNTVRYNTVTDNGAEGIYIGSGGSGQGEYGKDNIVTNNTACGNTGMDIDITGPWAATNTCESNTGDNCAAICGCPWTCDNLVAVYYDFDNDGLYSQATCTCGNILGVGACCNPGLFNSSGASTHCDGGFCIYPDPGDDANDCGAASTEYGCVAADGTVFTCGDVVDKSCTFNVDMTCPAPGPGLEVGADGVTIDGAGYSITGSKAPGACDGASESNPAVHSGIRIRDGSYDNVVILDLEIKEFCTGIALGWIAADNVDNVTVTDCEIHDNGVSDAITHGVHMVYTNECEITENDIYNNDGTGSSCSGGGNGIFMYGEFSTQRGWHNTFTYNDLLDNTKSGFFMKHQCMHNDISYNNATGNGEGGIAPMCKNSKFNNIANNNMSNNVLFGFKTQGSNNTIGPLNIASNNGEYGIVIVSGTSGGGHGKYNDVIDNTACENGVLDISVTGPFADTNTYDENTCDNSEPDGWCEYSCGVEQPDLIIEDIRPVRWCCCCIKDIKAQKGGDDSEKMQVMFIDDPELAKELGDEELRKEVAELLAKDPKLAEEVAAKLAGDDKEAAKKLSDPKLIAERCCCRCNAIKELADLLDTELTAEHQHEMSDQLDMIVGGGCCGGCCCDCLTAKCCCCGRFVAYKIRNNGTEDAGFSLSNLTVNGRVRSVDIVRPLDAQTSRWEVFPCYRMWWWPYWPREVTVCADITDWVTESNETNNCRTEWWPGLTPIPTRHP